MPTRHEVALDLGFQQSDSHDGLLWWFDKETENKIFFDFRIRDEDGGYKDDFNPDMPPRIYGLDPAEDDDDEDVWIDRNNHRERWDDEIRGHWVVSQVEKQSGVEDVAQLGITDFVGGVEDIECDGCGDSFDRRRMVDGLCRGPDTNDCYYEANPAQLFREAEKRKYEIRQRNPHRD